MTVTWCRVPRPLDSFQAAQQARTNSPLHQIPVVEKAMRVFSSPWNNTHSTAHFFVKRTIAPHRAGLVTTSSPKKTPWGRVGLVLSICRNWSEPQGLSGCLLGRKWKQMLAEEIEIKVFVAGRSESFCDVYRKSEEMRFVEVGGTVIESYPNIPGLFIWFERLRHVRIFHSDHCCKLRIWSQLFPLTIIFQILHTLLHYILW